MSKYFYGHYFKLQSDSDTIAFIPSYAKVGKAYTASLQVITKDESIVIDFPYEEYLRGDGFGVKIGNNVFNKDGMTLSFSKLITDIGQDKKRNIQYWKGNIQFRKGIYDFASFTDKKRKMGKQDGFPENISYLCGTLRNF